jgi:hypothetical protein
MVIRLAITWGVTVQGTHGHEAQLGCTMGRSVSWTSESR